MKQSKKIETWLSKLLDSPHFEPILEDSLSKIAPEIVTGFGLINQRRVVIQLYDNEVDHGYVSAEGAKKIFQSQAIAQANKMPFISLLASAGADLRHSVLSGDQYSRVINQHIALSGVIPQIALIMDPTFGGPAYASVLMDFIIMNKRRSHLMITAPNVVKKAIGEQVSLEELGGSEMHAKKTGLCDFLVKNTQSQFELCRQLIRFLPANYQQLPLTETPSEPAGLLPSMPVSSFEPFDIIQLINGLIDKSFSLYYKAEFGQSLVCLFAYIGGYPVGVMANQSIYHCGAVDIQASQKGSRFIQICSAYNIPLINLIDVPGFMPGLYQETHKALRYGAQFCHAMHGDIKRIGVIIRRCYGATAFLFMGSTHHGGQLSLALENTAISIMGQASTQQALGQDHLNLKLEDSLQQALDIGLIDELVPLDGLRQRLMTALAQIRASQVSLLETKQKTPIHF